jgi:peptidoglycan hydrolase CwlO-like protein
MSETVSIKKSTAKKISAIALCIILISVLGWFSYQSYLTDRATLTTQVYQLQTELANKNQEAAQLNNQITSLQSQLSNLERTNSSKNNDVVQLNAQIETLNIKIDQANQNITSLTNQLTEAEALSAQLEKIYPTPIIK